MAGMTSHLLFLFGAKILRSQLATSLDGVCKHPHEHHAYSKHIAIPHYSRSNLSVLSRSVGDCSSFFF